MLHIFISETTPEEKQRKLLRFEEKRGNWAGYASSNLTTDSQYIQNKPLYYVTVGTIPPDENMLYFPGMWGWQWSNSVAQSSIESHYLQYGITVYPSAWGAEKRAEQVGLSLHYTPA